MQDIKKIALLVLFIVVSCVQDNIEIFSNEKSSFIRFHLLVDNNNNVLEFPQVDNDVPVNYYEKQDFKVLKIPVALSAIINEEVTATFSNQIIGNLSLNDISITPNNNQLTFSKTKLVDTIYVKHNTRITNANSGKINFKITSVSNTDVQIGLNNNQENSSLEIDILPQNTLLYTFDKNREEITGIKGSTIDLKILFSNGFLESEIIEKKLFKISSAFDISIAQQPIYNVKEIAYKATLNEDLPEEFSFDVLLNLEEIDKYTIGAIDCFQINKPINADRSTTLNIASNFYNDNDPFYRLRGEYWRPDNDNPGECEWFNTNVFTVPVIVNKENPDAIQVQGIDTPDNTNDDIYYHRYKIGMVSPNEGRSTNPFALKNLLIGESSDNSAGFNIIEVLEFFPDEGNNATFGTVSVVAQKLNIVKSSDGKSFNVPVVGTGTYKMLNEATNLWRIDIDVTFDFSEINGTIKTLPYVYFNQPQPEPEKPIDINACFEPIEL